MSTKGTSINKDDVINLMLTKMDNKMTKADATLAVNSFMSVIQDAVKENKEVKMVGYMTVKVVSRKPRAGVNPQTKESIYIPAKNAVRVIAGSKLSEAASSLPIA